MFHLERPRQFVEIIQSKNVDIIVVFHFDANALNFYFDLSNEDRKKCLEAYGMLRALVLQALKEHADLIETPRIKIDFAIKEYKNPINIFALSEKNSNEKEIYFSAGIVFLTKELLKSGSDNKNNISDFIIHELTHAFDTKKHLGNYKKFKEAIGPNWKEPYYLLSTLDFMKIEGLANWTQYFLSHNKKYICIFPCIEYIQKYKTQIAESLKKEDVLTAYQISGSLAYILGLHMFMYISLAYFKRKNLDVSIIDNTHKQLTYEGVVEKMIKDEPIWFKEFPDDNLLKSLSKMFKLFDNYIFLTKYQDACNYLKIPFSKRIFTEEDIILILETKKYLK